MRYLLASAAIAATLVAAPAAFAANQTATGSIKAYDAKTHSITLDNGTTYALPAKMKAPTLKAGEKVQVSWVLKNGKYDATGVKVVK